MKNFQGVAANKERAKASTHGDYKEAQQTCRELEVKYGLEQLSTVHATRGYDRAEKATAVRDKREMHRSSLARKVRASASASATEGEFVRRARDTACPCVSSSKTTSTRSQPTFRTSPANRVWQLPS